MNKPAVIVIAIERRDPWFKVVGMLEQNWAFIDVLADGRARVSFVQDASGVFDQLELTSPEAAEAALRRNGFERLADDPRARSFLSPPAPPFHEARNPDGRSYSSGRFRV